MILGKTHKELVEMVAMHLGCNPDDPKSWPVDTIANVLARVDAVAEYDFKIVIERLLKEPVRLNVRLHADAPTADGSEPSMGYERPRTLEK